MISISAVSNEKPIFSFLSTGQKYYDNIRKVARTSVRMAVRLRLQAIIETAARTDTRVIKRNKY